MENASKALLIAAAVLIVILVIAFGMSIFNSAKDSGDATGAASSISGGITSSTGKLKGTTPGTAAYEFNQKVAKYLGKNKPSTTLGEIGQVFTNDGRTVSVTKEGFTTPSTEKQYTLEVIGYDDNGYINSVKVTQQP